MSSRLNSYDSALDECQRVLSLILTRLDDEEWIPTEYKDMARECIKGSSYATKEKT